MKAGAGADVALGIDLGTSSVKVVALDAEGYIVAEAKRGYTVDAPAPAWRQIDVERWWDAVCAAVRDVTGSLDGSVVAVGVTGQMHTVVALGANGRPVYPALMWNDARTAEMLPQIRRALADAGEPYLARLVSTGSPAANLTWLKQHEPDAFSALATFVIGPDWIVYRLTGHLGTDFCEASTSSLFDLERRCWSEVAQDALGLPVRLFPTVRGSLEVAGTVSSQVAAELGILPDVPVIVGTGDNPAAAVPTGCLSEGVPVLSLGTSGVLMAQRREPDIRAKGKNILVSLDGRHVSCLVQGVIQSCGSTRDWFVDELAHASFPELDAQVDPTALDERMPLFFPHCGGEKTLYGDPALRGAWLGLSTDASRADLHASMMSGFAYGFRQLAEEMDISLSGPNGEALRVVGGGARSDVWLQIIADVLGCSVQRLEGQSGAGCGVAALAWAAVGDAGRIPSCSRVGRCFDADEAAHARHQDQYARYLKIHDAVGAVYRA